MSDLLFLLFFLFFKILYCRKVEKLQVAIKRITMTQYERNHYDKDALQAEGIFIINYQTNSYLINW